MSRKLLYPGNGGTSMPSREVIKIKLSRFILRIFRRIRDMRTGFISQVTQMPTNIQMYTRLAARCPASNSKEDDLMLGNTELC